MTIEVSHLYRIFLWRQVGGWWLTDDSWFDRRQSVGFFVLQKIKITPEKIEEIQERNDKNRSFYCCLKELEERMEASRQRQGKMFGAMRNKNNAV